MMVVAAAHSQKHSDDISSLKQDVVKIETLVDRLDTAIVKLTEVSTNVSQLLAVHESKLMTQESLVKQIAEMVEVRRVETENKIQQLHSRVSAGEKELSKKIDDLYDTVMTELKEMRTESTEQHNKLSGRITVMERWMWIVIGGSIVVGFIIQRIPWATIF